MTKHLGLSVVMALAMAAYAGTARAGLMELTLTSGGATPVVVDDNGPGDSNLQPGIITYFGTVGNFSANITVGTSNSPGSVSGLVQLSSINVRNGNAGTATLTMTLSSTGFTVPPSTDTLALDSRVGETVAFGGASDEITFRSFADPTDALYGTAVSTPLQDSGPGATNYSSDLNVPFAYASTSYSITCTATLVLSPNAQGNISGTTTVLSTGPGVPEPASLAILALGGLAVLARRRRA